MLDVILTHYFYSTQNWNELVAVKAVVLTYIRDAFWAELIVWVTDFHHAHQFQRYLWSSSKVVRNRAEVLDVFSSPKFYAVGPPKVHLVHLGGYCLDSVPKFTRLLLPSMEGIALDHVFPILDILTLSVHIGDQILKLYKITQNFACLGPNLIPKFWDLHYKIHRDTDHVAKFHSNLLRQLRYPVAQ